MGIASFPWYDLAEIRWAQDVLWSAIRRELRERGWREVPAALERSQAYTVQWVNAELLLSQACGYDVLYGFADALRLVATPRFAAPGREGPNYSSHIVVRDHSPYEKLEDLRGARAAINAPSSHSGANALRQRVARLQKKRRFFTSVRTSGSHELSLRLIRGDEVDVAAIDCVTHALFARHRPVALAGTRVLESTPLVPAPPFVTAAAMTLERVDELRRALRSALADPETQDARDALLLEGIDELSFRAYEPIAVMRRAADTLGYREIPPG